MKTFGKFLTEAKDKGAVFTFGRFNPPTTGHAKLVDKLKKETGGGYVPLLFTSHSNDRQKNPLSHKDKIKYLRKFFGRIVVDANARTVFDIANELHYKGYKKIRMVVGSDRIKEFDMLLNKYNGVKARHGFYKFDSIEVVSAGDGEEGVHNYFRYKPDLILSDIRMPKLDGLEFLARVRMTDKDIPFLLCSGFYPGLSEDLSSSIHKPDHVLEKPVSADDVISAVSGFVNLKNIS